ncbi:MAG: tetratricopeptide repeat protein [Anaerolineae bacterium]|jgi:tetratricopeptide (TPR) repeat protein|nr:tetratricopeptide repeat protein [Anaerolineae bacterium]MDH7474057.1 tetratricopeptide repeat protein [Anaerolineae bacterium]
MSEERFQRAWEPLNTGDAETAHAEFARVVAENPEDVDALIGLSKALTRLGQLDEALKVLEAALSLAPGNAEVHYGTGCVYYQEKKWDEAAFHVQRAVDIAPDVARYHLMAAECARKHKDMETGLLHLEIANRIDPTLFGGRARWTLVYFRIFAGVEKLGLLVSWATLVTICSCNLSVASLHWRLLITSLPFLVVSGWNLKKGYRRRAIWSLVLCLLWAVSTYVFIGWIMNR